MMRILYPGLIRTAATASFYSERAENPPYQELRPITLVQLNPKANGANVGKIIAQGGHLRVPAPTDAPEHYPDQSPSHG